MESERKVNGKWTENAENTENTENTEMTARRYDDEVGHIEVRKWTE